MSVTFIKDATTVRCVTDIKNSTTVFIILTTDIYLLSVLWFNHERIHEGGKIILYTDHGFHLKLPSTNISNKYTCIWLTCYLKFCYQEFINACSDGMGSSIGSL